MFLSILIVITLHLILQLTIKSPFEMLLTYFYCKSFSKNLLIYNYIGEVINNLSFIIGIIYILSKISCF